MLTTASTPIGTYGPTFRDHAHTGCSQPPTPINTTTIAEKEKALRLPQQAEKQGSHLPQQGWGHSYNSVPCLPPQAACLPCAALPSTPTASAGCGVCTCERTHSTIACEYATTLLHVEQVCMSEMPPANAHSADMWWTLTLDPWPLQLWAAPLEGHAPCQGQVDAATAQTLLLLYQLWHAQASSHTCLQLRGPYWEATM